MSNRFYTLLLIPEKTSKVRRIVMPGWLFKGSLVGLFFVGVLGVMMLLDYWFVMGQIGENKQLKIENRRLRQQVQIFRNKITTIENTMDRIETFSTRLRIITDIQDRDNLVKDLNREELPDANTNVAKPRTPADEDQAAVSSEAVYRENDPENAILTKQQSELEAKLAELNGESLLVEQNLQDLYELLIDKKTFLAALPTVRPSSGYMTSGFGIRKSPYGRGDKMHEGLDIANYHGTKIVASANGVVRFAGRKAGYGRTVIIDHGYGLETWYGHNSAVTVEKGQKVRKGDLIAKMGSTGRSTGPHLHYEVRVHGIPVDPLLYVLEN